METRQFSKNAHISQNKFFTLALGGFFKQCEKGIVRKTAMEVLFFSAFTGHMAYVKCHMIILQCTITSNKHFIRGRSQAVASTRGGGLGKCPCGPVPPPGLRFLPRVGVFDIGLQQLMDNIDYYRLGKIIDNDSLSISRVRPQCTSSFSR